MSGEQELKWAPIPPKPTDRRRVWLIVGLIVAALVIVGVLLFFLLPRADSVEPGASASPSPSASASPTTTPPPTSEPEPTAPATTPPPVADPSIEAFRDRVAAWLDSAPTGLDIVSESASDQSLAVIDTLQADAQRLAETPAPPSIESEWTAGLAGYGDSLGSLRSAVEAGAGVESSVESARAAVNELRAVVGL